MLVDSNKVPLSFANEPVEKSADLLYIESLRDIGFSPDEIKSMVGKENSSELSELLERLGDGD